MTTFYQEGIKFEKRLLEKNGYTLIKQQSKQLKLSPEEAKYTLSYQRVGNKYYINHARGDLYFKVKKKKWLTNSSALHIWREMATCQIDTNHVKPFMTKDCINPQSIFMDIPLNKNNHHWDRFNIIPREQKLKENIEALKKKWNKEWQRYKRISYLYRLLTNISIMRIIILGSNGFTGRRILQRLSPKHQVLACSLHPDILPEEGYQFHMLNILDYTTTDTLLNNFQPEVIINASALSVVDYCEQLLSDQYQGIYHICGNETLSVSDIAYRVAKHFGLDPTLIESVTTEEMKERTPRPLYSPMNTEKAFKEFGYEASPFEKGLKEWN